jgi:hypothetical protein
MKMIENRLVGENTFENAVLRNFVLQMLCDFGDGARFEEAEVSDPGETGIMSAEARWSYGSLVCEVWIEAGSNWADPDPESFECGDFYLVFKWRTPERDGHWYELDHIFEWNEREATDCSTEHRGGLRLITW